ncbi:MAG: thrombospondin type 3 repeat-containing protein, partial [Prosthecobacter sp.]|nr:thrombospondin type 3 repeat-containing protein [Prosthecobacter sp.]
SDGDDDFDGDELTNLEELQSGTDPLNSDTDGDGLHDGWEISMSLNPNNGDQNGNGISDGEDEFDDDELTNLEELQSGTDPLNADTDGDGLPDGWESSSGLDPLDPTGVNGSNGDFDGDSLTNIQEFQSGSSPQSDDADNDGLKDAEEVKLGTNPNKADSDDDQVPDNEDGWPLDQALFFPHLPEVQYVVIELPEHLISIRNVSNDGVVFGYSTTNWDPGIWENGTWTLLPDTTEEHEYYSWSGMNRQGAVVGGHTRGKYSALGDWLGHEDRVVVYDQGVTTEFPPYYAHLPSNLDFSETLLYPSDLGLVIVNDGSVYARSTVYGNVTKQLPDDSFIDEYYHYIGVDKRTPTSTTPLNQTFVVVTATDLESWQEPAPSVTIPWTLYAANSHGIVLTRELDQYENGSPWGISLEGDDSMILDNGSQYLLKNVPGSEPNPSAPYWNVAYTVTDSATDPIIAGESNGRLALWAKRPAWKRIYHPDTAGSKIDGTALEMNIHGQILGRGFVSPNQPNLVGELIHNGRVVNLSERNSTHDIQLAVDISDTGIILAYATRKSDPNPPTDPSLYQKCLLIPIDIEGHKRGTISSPGAKVSKGSGEYGQETVMMENA